MKRIRTEADYEAALGRIDELMGAEGGTPEAEELDRLANLVEAYEERFYPIAPPPFSAALEFRMEQAGLNARQVAALIKVSPSRISEYLSGVRQPSKEVIVRIEEKLGIPLDHLLRTSEPEKVKFRSCDGSAKVPWNPNDKTNAVSLPSVRQHDDRALALAA